MDVHYWRKAGIGMVIGALLALSTAARVPGAELEVATFAGGCFWCVESDFDNVPGVKRTVSGYTGGHIENPTYKQVSSDTTGHREAVRIFFDPTQVSYAEWQSPQGTRSAL